MKKFIIRNPFVTENDKEIGCRLWRCADKLIYAALSQEHQIDKEQKYELMQRASELMNAGARYYGFRNSSDMIEWNKQHPDKKIEPF